MRRVLISTKFLGVLAGMCIMASAFFALSAHPPTAQAAIDNSPDCDNVAIIKCGVTSQSDLRAKYDRNTYGDLDEVYGSFGISESDMTGMVNGTVWRDGRVTVGDKTVARNAMTAGRNYGGTKISGTKNAGKYSTGKFTDNGQTALVKMSGGEFDFAVIKSCGNPVSATPVDTEPETKTKTKTKSATEAKTTQEETDTIPQEDEEEETVQPTYSCESLTYEKGGGKSYQFTVDADAANGARIGGYRFTISDGTVKNQVGFVYTYTFKSAGTYTIKAEPQIEVNGGVKYVASSNCTVRVTVAPEATNAVATDEEATEETDEADVAEDTGAAQETPVEADAQTAETVAANDKDEAPEEIASTGPAEFAVGGIGLGSLAASGYYFFSSRRTLLDKLLGR